MSKIEHDISIVGVCTHLAEQCGVCETKRGGGGRKTESGKREREKMHSMNVKYGILCVYELQRHQIIQMMSLTRQ